jgi:hypothetical protein
MGKQTRVISGNDREHRDADFFSRFKQLTTPINFATIRVMSQALRDIVGVTGSIPVAPTMPALHGHSEGSKRRHRLE